MMIELAELKENINKSGNLPEIQKRIEEIEEQRKMFITAVNSLSNSSFRAVLIARYLNNRKWEDIADEFGFSEERHIYRVNNAAIKAVTEFIKIP